METIDDELLHYGTPHNGPIPHSGRYEYGSGDNAYQRGLSFMETYYKMHKEGHKDTEIAKYFRENVPGYERFSTVDLRAKKSHWAAEERAANIARATRLKAHGNSTTEIGRLMGVNESTVRTWLNASENTQKSRLDGTADLLKNAVDKKGYIDIGAGVEIDLGVTKTNLDTAAAMLKEKGYNIYTLKVDQPNNPGNKTTLKVLAPPDATWYEVYKNSDKIKTLTDYSKDGGKTFQIAEYPSFISSDRVFVKYKEDGGVDKDGVVEIRRGVKDLSLGESSYAQIRIGVDDKYYIKGMALYSDDIPKGYDIVINSNKPKGTPLESEDKKVDTVLKRIKDDKDMPFGANISATGQSYYKNPNGNYVKEGDNYRKATDKDTGDRYSLSALNKLKAEGEWDTWSKSLSSQMLSKQPLELVKKQLNVTYADKKAEFDEIMSVTEPAVKQKLLEGFASDCDSSAVDLKAAALPRQSSRVILPINSLKDNQIYAPTYKDGEHVVLIRYPHAGTFEIPELVVNNKNVEGKKVLGNAKDAVGITTNTASVLSGADFDGDSVLVIPVNDRVKIKTSKPLEGLKGFNPSDAFPGYDGMEVIKSKTKQTEMGKVSNLITDMQIKGAPPEDLVRAVKHSMVVIDAEKHKLNYKLSEQMNGIRALKMKYQGVKPNGQPNGASTLVSKASSEKDVNERKYFWKPDPETGELRYEDTERTYVDKNGKTKVAKVKTTWMADTDDAYTLSSGYPVENAYAAYANKMKALANRSRKESLAIKPIEVDPKAKEIYKKEVTDLMNKLSDALANAPRERQAIVRANKTIKDKFEKEPSLMYDNDKKKKVKQQAMAEARAHYGAGKTLVNITDREWEAIQARAISTTTLKKILNNADLDTVKQLATPRTTTAISESKQARIKAMSKSGLYSIADMAEIIGVSTTTISKYIGT